MDLASATPGARGWTGASASTPPLRWPCALLLHLGPGVALVVFYLAAGPALDGAGLPPVWGLLIGVLVVVVPTELALVLRSVRQRGDTPTWALLGFRRVRRHDTLPLALVGGASLIAPGLVVWAEPKIDAAFFQWFPNWFSAGIADMAGYSFAVTAATFALWFVSVVVVGPTVEELYFRGWLLPRLGGGRWKGCLSHTAMFAVYHLWQPQAWLTVFFFAFPLAVLAATRRNVSLTVIVHCGVNLFTFAALLTGGMQR